MEKTFVPEYHSIYLKFSKKDESSVKEIFFSFVFKAFDIRNRIVYVYI